MSKIYKGWELMKAISDGEIKKKQKVRIIFNDGSGADYIFDGDYIVDSTHDNIFKIYGTKTVLKADFELIEDEIDIDNIKELEGIVEYATEQDTINKLIQAVKQIDKRVKKLER